MILLIVYVWNRLVSHLKIGLQKGINHFNQQYLFSAQIVYISKE